MAPSKSPSPPPKTPKAEEVALDTPQDEDAAAVLNQAETTIEAGSEESDPGYETDVFTSGSTSISSSVRDFAFENKRRYHKFHEGKYHFPNDESEQAREDMKHAMVVNLCGGRLHFAPLKSPQNVIDLGTGTGIWAIDFSDEYPSASVLGTDLSPIQPNWIPPNVKFMVDDAEYPWLHPPNHFDYVHARHSIEAFKNYPKLLSEAFDHIKPGGWIEFQEMDHRTYSDDDSLQGDYAVHRWTSLVFEALGKLGVNMTGAQQLATKLREAGFINVEEKIFKIPIGVWPKNKTLKMIGLYRRTIILDGLQGISLGPLTRGLGWSPEEVEVLLVEVRKALMDGKRHGYCSLYVVYGQKPE